MNVSVAVPNVMTMLHALTLMEVMSVPVTLDSLAMETTALVRMLFHIPPFLKFCYAYQFTLSCCDKLHLNNNMDYLQITGGPFPCNIDWLYLSMIDHLCFSTLVLIMISLDPTSCFIINNV